MNNYNLPFKRHLNIIKPVLFITGVLVTNTTLAADLPTGGQINFGEGQITQLSEQQMQVLQNTGKLEINWDSFNIGSGYEVNFKQPDANSIALNRVIGTDGSAIMGKLSSNGQVFIINPNGVLFGRTAQVDVGGLIASTLDINNTDFINDKLHFNGSDSSSDVINQGRIVAKEGGVIALLGGQVSNQGTIKANMGTVALIAGNAVTLDFAGDGLLNIQIDAPVINALAENQGLLKASGGQVLISAQASNALLQTVVNNQGIIEANSIGTRNGKIVLSGGLQGKVNISGTLDTSNNDQGDGGQIHIKGQNIALSGYLDASSALGQGGNIYTKGEQVQVANATRVNTRGSLGKTGQWQLTANTLSVNDYGEISSQVINNNLNTSNIELVSRDSDLTVESDIAWNSGNQLTLSAQQNIVLNANLEATGNQAGIAFNHGENNDYKIAKNKQVTLSGKNAHFSLNGDAYNVIQSVEQLQAIQNDLTGLYVLGNYIDASATSSWNDSKGFNPIGAADREGINNFRGVFSGLGNVINNLTIKQSKEGTYTDHYGNHLNIVSSGLFAASAGHLRNVGLTNSLIDSNGVVGGLVGYQLDGYVHDVYIDNAKITGNDGFGIGGLIGLVNRGTIENVSTSGFINGYAGVGGLIGMATNSTIKQVHSTATITLSPKNEDNYHRTGGGLIGQLDDSTLSDAYASGNVNGGRSLGGLIGLVGGSTINNVYASGNVVGKSHNRASDIGGLIGAISRGWKKSETILTNAYATGNVSTNYGGAFVGGLVGGISFSDTIISNVYATGDVDGGQDTGGLIGSFSNGSLSNAHATGNVVSSGNVVGAGGLIGNAERLHIDNVHATGNVSGSFLIGGLIGRIAQSSVNNSYATGNISAFTDAGGLIGGTYGSTGLEYLNLNNVYSSGNVSSLSNAGGLIGLISGAYTTINNSYTTSKVSGEDGIGGLIGGISHSIINISNTYANGDVAGDKNIGGLIGTMMAYSNQDTGNLTLNHTYAYGNVQGSKSVGALIGSAVADKIILNDASGFGSVNGQEDGPQFGQ